MHSQSRIISIPPKLEYEPFRQLFQNSIKNRFRSVISCESCMLSSSLDQLRIPIVKDACVRLWVTFVLQAYHLHNIKCNDIETKTQPHLHCDYPRPRKGVNNFTLTEKHEWLHYLGCSKLHIQFILQRRIQNILVHLFAGESRTQYAKSPKNRSDTEEVSFEIISGESL